MTARNQDNSCHTAAEFNYFWKGDTFRVAVRAFLVVPDPAAFTRPGETESRGLRRRQEPIIGGPRRVLQSLRDILLFEIGVLGDDLRLEISDECGQELRRGQTADAVVENVAFSLEADLVGPRDLQPVAEIQE
jgi:hypothetical protein